MLFVDGENFTLRAEDICKAGGFKIAKGTYYRKSTYLWHPKWRVHTFRLLAEVWKDDHISQWATRAHYYTSLQGDADAVFETKQALWRLDFHPEVFKKPQGKRAKGVDITLSRDVLSHVPAMLTTFRWLRK